MKKYISIVILSLTFFSCSQQYYNFGWIKFFEKDYKGAEEIFNNILLKNPNDAKNLKGLGITQFMLKKYDDALMNLEKSYSADKSDPETSMNLGLAYEAKEKYDKAMEYYLKFFDSQADSKLKYEVEKLLSNLKKKIYQSEAKTLIDGEKSISDKDITTNSIAIIPFVNRGQKGDFDVLQKGLPQMITTDFGYVPSLSLLERMRVDELIKEMKLSENNFADKTTAQRLGKLLKAENIVTGSFAVSGNNSVRLDLFVINLRNNQMSEIIEQNGTVSEFFTLQKDLSLGALEKMSVRVTEDQRKKIKALPTESFFEFLAALKKKALEEEEFVPQGVDFLDNLFIALEAPVTQITTVSSSVTPDVKPTINPVETPLPRPPAAPR